MVAQSDFTLKVPAGNFAIGIGWATGHTYTDPLGTDHTQLGMGSAHGSPSHRGWPYMAPQHCQAAIHCALPAPISAGSHFPADLKQGQLCFSCCLHKEGDTAVTFPAALACLQACTQG